jgi:lysozyme
MNLDALIAALKIDEGFRPLVYDDFDGKPITKGSVVKGYPTIGYGWNVASDPISETDAADRLKRRAIRAQQDACALIPNWLLLNDVRQNVVSNMAYNLGKARISSFKKFLAAVNEGRYDDATAEMVNSKWYGQVGARAVRLSHEMLTGSV